MSGLLIVPIAACSSSESDEQPALCGQEVDSHHSGGTEWTYGDPQDWSDLHGDFTSCGNGERQTPIDLSASAAAPTNAPLAFWAYDKAIPLNIENNGHTLQVNYAGSKSATDPHVTYKGKEYYLLQLHFHTPSEHTIDGEHALMEVHFVHEAADGSKAVVGVFTEDGADNEALAKILANRPRNGKTIEGCNADLDLRALVSVGETSFHYQGSLTTPPCSEGLQWWVMTQRIAMNREQRERYASLFPTETNRPVQPLNGRPLELYTDPAQ